MRDCNILDRPKRHCIIPEGHDVKDGCMGFSRFSRYVGFLSSRQFSSYDWLRCLRAHSLAVSQRRRGDCHDSATAESFCQLLKRERIRRRIYVDREAVRRDVFDYIEKMFYNLMGWDFTGSLRCRVRGYLFRGTINIGSERDLEACE